MVQLDGVYDAQRRTTECITEVNGMYGRRITGIPLTHHIETDPIIYLNDISLAFDNDCHYSEVKSASVREPSIFIYQ